MNNPCIRRALEDFDFSALFIHCLGWSNPQSTTKEIGGVAAVEIARLGPIPALYIQRETIPETSERQKIGAQIARVAAEHILVFADDAQTQCVLAWHKRSHVYIKGQPAELFISKLAALIVELNDYAQGDLTVIAAAKKLQEALDTSKVTNKFYNDWKEIQIEIAPLIEGLPDDKTRAQYSLVLLHRLMFIYFLQKRGFVDDDARYLENKFEVYSDGGFYQNFLKPLFFEGFAQPEAQRSAETIGVIGDVKYLNGGLFLPHPLEREFPNVNAPDLVFEKILKVFGSYDWFADDSRDNARGLLSPELLGFIFEKFINDQKSAGAYYTPEALTSYLCQRTIEDLILDEVKIYAGTHARRADSVFDLIGHANPQLCEEIWARLKDLRVLDPAVGSGAFLVAAFYTLSDIYVQLYGRAASLGLKPLLQKMMGDEAQHASPFYAMHRRIITHNLYGVDLMEGAPEIARLRLFLALVSSAKTRDELEPLPNIDFNILEGNSLIGMMSCDEKDFIGGGLWVQKEFEDLRNQKSNRINLYKTADESMRPQLAQLRIEANEMRDQLRVICNDATVAHWNALGIKRAGWKGLKRTVDADDIARLRPFHWGAEFPEAMQSGGFDAILTNPPWEVFQTSEKEFTQQYDSTVTKNKIRIEEWAEQFSTWMKDPEFAAAWNEYENSFPYVLSYFKKSPDYKNQISEVDGRGVGNKLNLNLLFVERCYRLVKQGGRCGIVIPSGIYTDLGAKGLREMLFAETQITGLFGFENRKPVFDGVHRSLKFAALTWLQDGKTTKFPAAFMRHDVDELAAFPNRDSLEISVDLVRKLAPDSLSVMEFKNERDVEIAEKMLCFPMLGDQSAEDGWKLELYGEELNMTRSRAYFSGEPTDYVLYEGGMIWHFNKEFSAPRRWVKEQDLRATFKSKKVRRINGTGLKVSQIANDYETTRLAIRKIASNTNERTLISTLIPPRSLAGNSLSVHFPYFHGADNYLELRYTGPELLFLVAVLNSFVMDAFLRSKMTTNLNLFYLYQLPVPRLTSGDAEFDAIVSASARLICTTAEFDALAREAGLSGHAQGAATPDERAALRAQLDARIARLYGLNETEFAHILATFPLVDEPTKLAARNAFRDLERGVE